MSNDAETIDQLNREIETNRAKVKTADALARLLKNPDFVAIIQDGYCTSYALSLVSMLKADHASPETRAKAQEKLEAISLFQEFIRVTGLMNNGAREAIEEAQATIDEIRGE